MGDEHLETGCILPLAQAALVGIACGLLAAALCWLFDAPHPEKWASVAASLGFAGWLLTGFGYWRSIWYNTAYPWHIHQGEQGPDEQEPERTEPAPVVRIEQVSDQGRRVEFRDIPTDFERLAILAVGLLEGMPITESHWTGPGKTFTRREFSDIRTALIKAGWLAWNSPGTPARGCSLTRPGRAALQAIADQDAGDRAEAEQSGPTPAYSAAVRWR